MTCSGVCRVRFIESLQGPAGAGRDSHSGWIRFRGAGQKAVGIRTVSSESSRCSADDTGRATLRNISRRGVPKATLSRTMDPEKSPVLRGRAGGSVHEPPDACDIGNINGQAVQVRIYEAIGCVKHDCATRMPPHSHPQRETEQRTLDISAGDEAANSLESWSRPLSRSECRCARVQSCRSTKSARRGQIRPL
jgi:hypothetical protein